MEEEFFAALNDLEQDPQPIHLVIARIQGLSVLQSVQLANCSLTNSHSLSRAAAVGRKIEQVVTIGCGSHVKQMAAFGWDRIPLSMPEKEALKELQKVGHLEVKIHLSKIEAWYLITAIQFSDRHPEFSESVIGKLARNVAKTLQNAIATEGILSLMLHSGWDPRFDMVVEK